MRALISILAVLLASPIFAASAQAAEEKGKAPEGNYVDVSPVACPIVVNGVLVNFIFVTLRLNVSPRADVNKLREKEPYFRDAFVRTAYRQPFVRADSYIKVDEKAVVARMTAEVNRIAGPGAFSSVQILGDPQPKRISGLPRPAGAPAPVSRAPIP